jgi:response regulator RpfG family c-di-GMP phosphodiesterase
MSSELPYKFNKDYDHKSGYKTQSILAIPLRSFNNKLVGVMQLINAKDDNRNWISFSDVDRVYVSLFASHAAVAIERAMMNREMFLRMVRIAELHDPLETGVHVQRVSAFSGELYQRWATKRGYDKKEIKQTKDLLRIASMLHDVGKVGISDLIIKKPGKLTDQEYDVMKWHTVYGARLFASKTSELDCMCFDISLNHHEKWAGGGYPGFISDIVSDEIKMGIPKKGEEIPISARVTALADVYDALSSRRSYKDPWPEEKIVAIIKEESNKHFDPELVEAFLDIHDVLLAIREKYK